MGHRDAMDSVDVLGKRLLFVVNAPEFFLSHRLQIAQEASREGFDVHVATAPGE